MTDLFRDDLKMVARSQIVTTARSWIGTPYHHAARLKGVGVDCGQILIAVYAEAGLIEDFQPEYYPRDFMMHRHDEKYLGYVRRYCQHEKDHPEPGDIAVWRIGKVYSHGGIVTDWPHVVHAYLLAGKVVEDNVEDTDLNRRPCRFFSYWD